MGTEYVREDPYIYSLIPTPVQLKYKNNMEVLKRNPNMAAQPAYL